MAKKHAADNGSEAKKDGLPVAGTIRKVVLASVGAVGVAQDEVNSLVKRMVERGELTEKDARKLLSDFSKEFNKRRKAPAARAEEQLEAMLEKMNIPSKQDIEDLSKQIAYLSRRIEDLKAQITKT
jgi:poly(hydroxyalkanoate) granule-associated protein